jgi:hypothetical protein
VVSGSRELYGNLGYVGVKTLHRHQLVPVMTVSILCVRTVGVALFFVIG